MRGLMQTLRNPASSPQAPLLTLNHPYSSFLSRFFVKWGWQPRPRGFGKEQRTGSLAGSCTTTVQPTVCLQAKQRQPGRDAPGAAPIKVPQHFPFAKLHYSTFGPRLKGFQGASAGFAQHLPPPCSIPDEDGSCRAGSQAAEPSHLLRLLESFS